MKLSNQAGFTIIETMLFLSITGILAVGILAGTSSSINIQRYHDSVTSLQSVLQQQYSNVANTSNDNSGDLVCNSDGTITSGSGVGRGQSDCVILGKLITTTSNKTLLIRDMIGYLVFPTANISNDIDAFKQYKIQASPLFNETYNIEWGSSLVRIGAGGVDKAFSMLVLRSPSSGVIRTFIDDNSAIDGDVSSVADLINKSTSLTTPAKICVNSNGLFAGKELEILVGTNTTSASGVEILGDGDALNEC